MVVFLISVFALAVLVVVILMSGRPGRLDPGSGAALERAQPPPAPDAPEARVFEEFSEWSDRFRAASTAPERTALLAQGQSLARQRRAALAELIRRDPQRALGLAVPDAVRAALPGEIARHLEEPVSGRGDFLVLIADDFERQKSTTLREVVIHGRRYQAFVYRRRAESTSQHDIPLRGIAVDNLMAVQDEAESPAATPPP